MYDRHRQVYDSTLPVGRVFAGPVGPKSYCTDIDVIHRMKVRMQLRKSCGTDGMKPVLYKRLPECYDYFLVQLFQQITLEGFPSTWRSSVCVPLHKGKPDRSPAGFRTVFI